MADKKQAVGFREMEEYLRPLKNPGQRKMVGRKEIVKMVLATLNRDEISNAALIGEAGSGKTTIAYGVADLDTARDYYEVKLSLMSASDGGINGAIQMATRMTRLIDEVIDYQTQTHKQLVLFMDEFHIVMETSPAAMEALKPVLANSGARGIKIIVATTFEEYNQWVRPNEALSERLERIVLPELNFDETVGALKGAMQVHLPKVPVSERLMRRIVEVTDSTMPSQSQPRKSLRVLDSMTGWYKTFGGEFDEKLLAHMMKMSFGFDIDYQVDVNSIERRLNARVFDQPLAVRAMVDRLNISVAHLNDETRPRGSFLYTGPTGVGKTELAKAISSVLYGNDSSMIRFDMSEYSKADSVDTLRDRLADEVRDKPSSIILMDEIEKASETCSKLMLQVLDDARLSDRNGREVSFKDAYLIFTTNAGASVYRDLNDVYSQPYDPNESVEQRDDRIRAQEKMLQKFLPLIMTALQNMKGKFPSELLGRFDAIVPFSGLQSSTRYKIFNLKIRSLAKKIYQKYGVTMHIDKRVAQYIVAEYNDSSDTSSGGGREITRKINQTMVPKLATLLITHPELSDIGVDVSGKMAAELVGDREGNAQIEVGRWIGSEQ